MGRWKIGSFTAAIGCIVLGVIIVLAQFDVVTYDALGFIWPALLILFGLEMLLRLFIRSEVKSRVSGWAVVLIIVLVAASGAQTVLTAWLNKPHSRQDTAGSAQRNRGGKAGNQKN